MKQALAYQALGADTLARREAKAVLVSRPDHAGALELLGKQPGR